MRNAYIWPLLVGLASLLVTTGCAGRHERPPDKYSAENDTAIQVSLHIEESDFPEKNGPFEARLIIRNTFDDSLCIPSLYLPWQGLGMDLFTVRNGRLMIPYIGIEQYIVNTEPGLYYVLPPGKIADVRIPFFHEYDLSKGQGDFKIQYRGISYPCSAFRVFRTSDFLADIHPLITLVSNWATFEYSGEK